jgi:hypothetical protein
MFASPPANFFLDPWASDYGSGLEAQLEAEPEAASEPPEYIEQPSWLVPVTPAPSPRPDRIVFVDGVQRVDAYGRVESGGLFVEAALASVAVGGAICETDAAEFASDPVIERVFAVTGGISASRLEVRAGSALLAYLPHSHATRGAAGIRLAVQERRSELERSFAEALVSPNALIVLDGRLSFDPGGAGAVVGFVKTIFEFYVDEQRRRLLTTLEPGQRSPVFRIQHGRTTRYSWFLKLPHTQPIHHPFAGLVRLETPEVGESRALALADLTSHHLPAFASRPEKDPRAPQNLIPVGALEWKLRHLLGDATFVRRSIERALYGAAA